MNHCCEIGCEKPAVYELTNTETFESNTQSCEQHVAELFFDGCNSIERLDNAATEVASSSMGQAGTQVGDRST